MHGSLFEMPFEDNYFDIVVSWGVLHHTGNPFDGLKEMKRVCKKGGFIGFFVYNSFADWRHNIQRNEIIKNGGEEIKERLDYAIKKYSKKPFDTLTIYEISRFYDQYVQPIKKNSKIIIDGHDYSKFYEDYFKIIKNKKLNILEIGSFYGNASAALFFYFQKANIFSADIFPDLFSYSSERIKNFYTDSSKETSIEKHIIKLNQSFDIIIEDASHSFKDQIISLFMLFHKLNPGGIFIVEELDFPDTRKDMNLKNERPTLRDILIDIQANKDFTSKFVDISQKDLFLSTFDKIKILKGKFNEFAIITKKK